MGVPEVESFEATYVRTLTQLVPGKRCKAMLLLLPRSGCLFIYIQEPVATSCGIRTCISQSVILGHIAYFSFTSLHGSSVPFRFGRVGLLMIHATRRYGL